jgi:hypothetical protein
LAEAERWSSLERVGLQAHAGDDADDAALGVACEAKLYSGKCEGCPNYEPKKITNHKSKREIVIAATAKPGFLIMCHRTSFFEVQS